LLVGIFAYGFSTFKGIRTPKEGLEINVTGRQWLWQFRYPNERISVNELRLPVNEPIKLVMSSDDVIHDFYVPEFRLKQDILPNRYTYMWFTPTKTGTYDIFCAEYCGTGHSAMLGKLVVLEKATYKD
jgi:cytochrome c oxidase subunit 2